MKALHWWLLGILLGAGALRGSGWPAERAVRAHPTPGGISAIIPPARPWPGTPTPTPACPPGWQTVPGPNGGTYPTLRSVSASGPSDVWAVGQLRYGQNIYHTWTAHWDGTTWATVPSPNVGTGTSALDGVVAISPTDVWAVGYSQDYTGNPTLTMHWDGSAWTVVSSPGVGGLRSVAALASNDVWAAGTDSTHTLILHWDGSTWTQVPSPSITGLDNTLEGIAARATADIWAVGAASTIGTAQALIEHWDGTSWTLVPSPAPGPTYNYLEGVATLAANDVWTVGGSADGTNLVGTLVEHWDGSAWTIVPGPPVVGFLYSVAGRTASNLWAVGTYQAAPNTNNRTLLAHWDGSAWTQVASPNPGYGNNWLYGVTLLSDSEGWAVGSSSPGPPVLHYTANCGPTTPSATPPTPTATATATPPPLTATPTPPPPSTTPTPPPPTATTPTATVCPVQFSDVPPGSTFYDGDRRWLSVRRARRTVPRPLLPPQYQCHPRPGQQDHRRSSGLR